MRHQTVFQKALAWSGLICPGMFFAAFALAGFIPPLVPDESAAEVAAHYQSHTTGIRIGAILMMCSGMFYAAFTAVISAQMARVPGVHRSAVITQAVAGAFACLTFMVPGMILVVVAFRPDRDPEMTQTLNDFFWIFLVLPWPPFATQNWAFAYVILTDPQAKPLFPRWLGYLNIWAPIVFSPSVMLPFFKSGVFAWSGLFVIWIPAVVFIIQFVANVWCLMAAVNDEDRELEGPASRAPDPRGVPSIVV
jgi:hypothetical protein